MIPNLLKSVYKILPLVLILFIQKGVAQDKSTDEKLFKLVDKYIQSPIKETVDTNGDVFLQRDMSSIFESVTATRKYDSNHKLVAITSLIEGDDHNHGGLSEFLNNPQPSVKTMEKYFAQAANEFQVPIEILKAMGQVQSNWSQVPESDYGSFGVMGLIENHATKQISLASKLAKTSNEAIIEDPKTNIRAAASLLAYYQKNYPKAKTLEDWYQATRELTGLTNEEMKTSLANRVYKIINEGSKSITNWKEIITIPATKVSIPSLNQSNKTSQVAKTTIYTVDYAPAKPRFSLCDTSNSNGLPNPRASDGVAYLGLYSLSRNGSGINYYFIHYMATGTYEGAISYFGDCYRTTQSSANYCIRNVDGEISQVVKESHRAFAQGVTEYNNGGIGTEHEVLATNLAMWDSEPMLVASANLAIDVCNRNGIARTRRVNNGERAIYGHSDVRATDCPNLTQARWDNLMARISGGIVIPSVAMPTLFSVMNPGIGSKVSVSWKANTEPSLLGYRLYYATDESQVTWALAADEATLTATTTSIVLNQADFKVVPTTDVYHFRLTAVIPNGTNPIVESLASDVYSRSANVTGKKVLIVDGFDRIGAYTKSFHNFATNYFNELKNNGSLQISSTANEKVEDGTIALSNYDMVVWFTGDDSSANVPLSTNEKNSIKTYLENGGKLLLSGSEIGYNLGRSAAALYDLAFMNGYLKSSYISDGVVGDTPAKGIIGGPFDSVTCALGVAYPEKFPDNLAAYGGATNIFSYTSVGKFGGIAYSGNFGSSSTPGQLVYVGFGIENVSQTDRDSFMKKALTYFNVNLLGVADVIATINDNAIIYPNPFTSEVKINFNTNQVGKIEIRIIDLSGRVLKEASRITSGAFGNQVSLDTENLPKGIYLSEVQFPDGQIQSNKLIKK
nr:N-acetylmuramoyl-L-alanine amidase [uncultured Flavobacterium sp.]